MAIKRLMYLIKIIILANPLNLKGIIKIYFNSYNNHYQSINFCNQKNNNTSKKEKRFFLNNMISKIELRDSSTIASKKESKYFKKYFIYK